MTGSIAWLGILWLALAGQTQAEVHHLTLPLNVPYALLDDLNASLTTQGPISDGRCRQLQVRDPRLEPRTGQLHLLAEVDAVVGVELFGTCVEPLHWRGRMDATLQPYLDPRWQLHFHLDELELRDPDGGRAPLLSILWKLGRGYVNRRVQTYSLDLSAPREPIRRLLGALIVPGALAQVETILAEARAGTPTAGGLGVELPIHLQLPDTLGELLEPPEEAPELSAEQLLERLDAFLVVVVKHLGEEIPDPPQRRRLIDLLLDSRYRLVTLLTDPPVGTGNPVRALFLDNWAQLREILLDAESAGFAPSQLARYVAFLNVGDLLLALDRTYPTIGLWLSAPGLRALLYELAPQAPADPLDYGFAVDPALRSLFGLPPDLPPVPPPEPPPELSPEPPQDPPLAEPDARPADTDAGNSAPDDDESDDPAGPSGGTGEGEPPEDSESSSPRPGQLGVAILDHLVRSLISAVEAADAGADPITQLQQTLGRRVPHKDELESHARLVHQLLGLITTAELASAELAPAHAQVFRDLVPATALIESCWRQYKTAEGRPTYVVSSAGAVGMMQINQRVWRGIYDVERLKWETAYNVRAGVQILLRYLKGPGLDLIKRSGEEQHLPRATYAAYNAGPRGAGRFLKKDGSLAPGPVDRRLWEHYQGFRRGGTADLSRCSVTPKAAAPAESPSR